MILSQGALCFECHGEFPELKLGWRGVNIWACCQTSDRNQGRGTCLFTLSSPRRDCSPIPDAEAPGAQLGPAVSMRLSLAVCSGRRGSPVREATGAYPDVVEVHLFEFRVVSLYPLQRFLHVCRVGLLVGHRLVLCWFDHT